MGQRNSGFEKLVPLGTKKGNESIVMFENYTQGILTSRDSWCYNSSRGVIAKNIKDSLGFYIKEKKKIAANPLIRKLPDLDKVISNNAKRISWSHNLKNYLLRGKEVKFDKRRIITSTYRPFIKQHLYFDRQLNERVYQIPSIFPDQKIENKVICITGIGSRSFSCLMLDTVPSYDMHTKGQCFPLKLYEKIESKNNKQESFFTKDISQKGYKVTDGITEEGLAFIQSSYPKEDISKEDIFYYIYGLLHSEDYRSRYSDNLSKQLPRIACVKKSGDFWLFVDAGKKLAKLHLGYEKVKPYKVTYEGDHLDIASLKPKDLYVTKMKFGPKKDKTTVVYNHKITMQNIPLKAYGYIVTVSYTHLTLPTKRIV